MVIRRNITDGIEFQLSYGALFSFGILGNLIISRFNSNCLRLMASHIMRNSLQRASTNLIIMDNKGAHEQRL